MKSYFWLFGFFFFVEACQPPTHNFQEISANKLFTLLPSQRTDIEFVNQIDTNQLPELEKLASFLQGGGVAIGDINNDGLPDIYLTANQTANQLYLNLGNFRFKNITQQAHVAGKKGYTTAVSMADINADGLLDIYVCKAETANELFIHQGFDADGNPIFAEKAHEYGLDDKGFSRQAIFFDYDQDGDLDVFVANEQHKTKSPSSKLYRNDQKIFRDISQKAGLANLYANSISVSDINQDNFLDIYVSNSYQKNDKLFLNSQHAIFVESPQKFSNTDASFLKNTDIADLDNDALVDIFVSPNGQSNFLENTENQVVRNYFYLNEKQNFKEIAYFANLRQSSFGGACLIADLNNDGSKDIFVSNGNWKNILEKKIMDSLKKEKSTFKKIIHQLGTKKSTNQIFANYQQLNFVNKAQDWGLAIPNVSSSVAYGDLDNDGDLDLVVNNFNDAVSIYRNESNKFTNNNYLKIRLIGENKNTYGIGSKVVVKCKGKSFFLEQMPNRSFQSSVEPVLNFGLGEYDYLDTVAVFWANGQSQIVTHLQANQFVTFEQKNALSNTAYFSKKTTLSEKIFENSPQKSTFLHQENAFDEHEREAFLPFVLSQESPCLATGDINGDGLEDFFVGNARNAVSMIFLQTKTGFVESPQKVFEQDKAFEDTDAIFFDADNDGDLDLYVVSGSHEWEETSPFLQDRLYLNDSKGNFTKSKDQLPADFQNGSCVKVADWDKDNDLDILICGRSVPLFYGLPAENRLLINDGKGNFEDHTKEIAPTFYQVGMFNDAVFVDYDQDQDLDIVAVGDWTSPMIFQNQQGVFENVTQQLGLDKMQAWWQSVLADDLDNDGDLDLVLGNFGQNFSLKSSEVRPVTAYIKDFGNNGKVEQIIGFFEGNKLFPTENIHKIAHFIPSVLYKKNSPISGLFSENELKDALELHARSFKSVLLENKNGEFEAKVLPKEAQFSPVQSLLAHDFDQDGIKDLLLVGNYSRSYFDASQSQKYSFLKGKGKNRFEYVPNFRTNLPNLDSRKIKILNEKWLIMAIPNQKVQFFEFGKNKPN